jgi:hypothetical protein
MFAFALWQFEIPRTTGFILYLALVCLAVGYVWGLLMWKFIVMPRLARSSKAQAQSQHPPEKSSVEA